MKFEDNCVKYNQYPWVLKRSLLEEENQQLLCTGCTNYRHS